jgi:hypothetical protein
MSKKYNAVALALAATATMLKKLNDNYGSLDSQDAEFKALKGAVDNALALPEDPTAGELAPTFTVMSLEQITGLLNDVRKAIPAPVDVVAMVAKVADRVALDNDAIVAKVVDHLEQSDVAVMSAIASTRADILKATAKA